MQNRDAARYLNRRFYKNRSPMGVILDGIVLRGLFFLASLMFFARRIPKFGGRLLLSLISLSCFCILLHIVHRLRYEAFLARELNLLQRDLLFKNLWKQSDEELRSLVSPLLNKGEQLCILRRVEAATGNDILIAYDREQHQALLSTAGFTPKARQFAQACAPQLRLIEPDALLGQAAVSGLLPSPGAAAAEMARRYAETKQQRRKTVSLAFSNAFPGKYFLTAALLILFSFFTAHALYYRLLAMLSVSIALMGSVLSLRPNTDQHP